jgi:hypothetical protein
LAELPTDTVPKSTDEGVAAIAAAPLDVVPEDVLLKTTPPHPRIPKEKKPITRYARIAVLRRGAFSSIETPLLETGANSSSQILTLSRLKFGVGSKLEICAIMQRPMEGRFLI